MIVQIKINDSDLDNLVIESMVNCYYLLKNEVKQLKTKRDDGPLLEYQQINLTDAKGHMKHLRKTIKYYCSPSEFKELDLG